MYLAALPKPHDWPIRTERRGLPWWLSTAAYSITTAALEVAVDLTTFVMSRADHHGNRGTVLVLLPQAHDRPIWTVVQVYVCQGIVVRYRIPCSTWMLISTLLRCWCMCKLWILLEGTSVTSTIFQKGRWYQNMSTSSITRYWHWHRVHDPMLYFTIVLLSFIRYLDFFCHYLYCVYTAIDIIYDTAMTCWQYTTQQILHIPKAFSCQPQGTYMRTFIVACFHQGRWPNVVIELLARKMTLYTS